MPRASFTSGATHHAGAPRRLATDGRSSPRQSRDPRDRSKPRSSASERVVGVRRGGARVVRRGTGGAGLGPTAGPMPLTSATLTPTLGPFRLWRGNSTRPTPTRKHSARRSKRCLAHPPAPPRCRPTNGWRSHPPADASPRSHAPPPPPPPAPPPPPPPPPGLPRRTSGLRLSGFDWHARPGSRAHLRAGHERDGRGIGRRRSATPRLRRGGEAAGPPATRGWPKRSPRPR